MSSGSMGMSDPGEVATASWPFQQGGRGMSGGSDMIAFTTAAPDGRNVPEHFTVPAGLDLQFRVATGVLDEFALSHTRPMCGASWSRTSTAPAEPSW
jgi:hypothetical protein